MLLVHLRLMHKVCGPSLCFHQRARSRSSTLQSLCCNHTATSSRNCRWCNNSNKFWLWLWIGLASMPLMHGVWGACLMRPMSGLSALNRLWDSSAHAATGPLLLEEPLCRRTMSQCWGKAFFSSQPMGCASLASCISCPGFRVYMLPQSCSNRQGKALAPVC